MSVEDFLNGGVVKLDNNIEERVKKASLNGNVLRYVCVIEGARYLHIHVTPFKTPIEMLICIHLEHILMDGQTPADLKSFRDLFFIS